ncbi:hypothetical protein [Umezawaea sp. Da 62-37]|uniref:hypothetical protein n=1 Tax=Umezawaea sp. Da 62-37 TaxID=3075927 RepID=UPI0028F6F67E|nr:hypothetical protein [Umezawaea sp. Da 62-37]WNV82076.1 hypothetical protein RM788_28110 [Umezawaea sp. Da 62-37]
MTGISVALEALRADAGTWVEAAEAVDRPRTAVAGLRLSGVEMSRTADELGLDLTYDKARAAVEDMLGQAARRFRELGASLIAAADTYQREDELGMHTMNGIGGGA